MCDHTDNPPRRGQTYQLASYNSFVKLLVLYLPQCCQLFRAYRDAPIDISAAHRWLFPRVPRRSTRPRRRHRPPDRGPGIRGHLITAQFSRGHEAATRSSPGRRAQSEFASADVMISALYPCDPQEALDHTVHTTCLSRFAGTSRSYRPKSAATRAKPGRRQAAAPNRVCASQFTESYCPAWTPIVRGWLTLLPHVASRRRRD